MMTVGNFVDTREADTWGKRIRILDNKTHDEVGKWYDNAVINKRVKSIKASKKYLFIFI